MNTDQHIKNMKPEIKLNIISGTDRANSHALKIARHLEPRYEKLGAEAEIISLEDFPLCDVAGGKYRKQIKSVGEFNARVLNCDGLIFVIPEYNGSFPGILKMFIDYLPFPSAFEKLPICMVGEATGTFGALRAVEQFQGVCGYRNAYIFPERVFIPHVKDNFDEKEGIRNSFENELLTDQIHNFYAFVKGVKQKKLTGNSYRIEAE